MAKMLKVGVIGVGGIAKTHYPGWEKSPDAELAGLADLSAKVLQEIGKEHGITKLYEKPQDLIDDPDIDIIDICTPNMYHAPLAIAALQAGKHVICEKPLAPTPDDIRELIKARDKSGKLLMTAQHMRYEGHSRALKAEVDAGKLGEIYHARAWMLRRAATPLSPGFIYKKNSGGGPCIDIGVHVLDTTLWMMGHPKPISVTGVTQDKLLHQAGAFSVWGGAIPTDIDVEEFAAAMIRFDNGATMILEVSWMLHHATDVEEMKIWLYGDKGGALWPQNTLYTTDNATQQQFDTQLKMKDSDAPHALECVAFADAVANGKPSPVPAEQSLDVQTILHGLYQSAATKREVSLV